MGRSELLRYKVNMYRLCEERDIEPETMANLVSSSLYERRFGPYFVSPVIAGINQRTGKPFICGFDSIGSMPLPASLCCPICADGSGGTAVSISQKISLCRGRHQTSSLVPARACGSPTLSLKICSRRAHRNC